MRCGDNGLSQIQINPESRQNARGADQVRGRTGGKATAHASITCHVACHNFIAGFPVEYGNSGAGMHRGAFSLWRKRTSPRPNPRASKCRAGLASDPGSVTWGTGCRQYVSGQQSDSLPARPWQRRLALFRSWWSVPYHLKKPCLHTRGFCRPGKQNRGQGQRNGGEPIRDGSSFALGHEPG